MNYETDPSRLERLQREALICLNGFPNKVRALNDIIATYAPEVTRKSLENITHNVPGIPLTQESSVEESSSMNLDGMRRLNHFMNYYDALTYFTMNKGFFHYAIMRFIRNPTDDNIQIFESHEPVHLETSLASASNLDRSLSRQKISKRNHHGRRLDHKMMRRRPGPLSHILAFLSNSLAACTKATVIRPSRYIAHHALTMLRDTLIQRGQLIHVQCGPSTIWSLPEGKASLELQIDLGVTVKNCIGIMRPAVAQLIADTTKLKRWLQVLAVTFAPPTIPLIHAIRRTEAIDGWAYELFFHLKYLQGNRICNVEKKATEGLKVIDDVRNTNLWQRLVQLRDNYVFLYESLYSNDQYLKFSRGSTEMII